MTQLRITVKNTSETGGTFLTPVYFGFHDGSFDLFDIGAAASPGLEQLAEDGAAAGLTAERLAADADSQGVLVTGAAGPIAATETTSATIEVDGASNGSVSLAAMILPSNDAFIGTDQAVRLFDAQGDFLGARTLVFEGGDVYDAGTEVNTERDAAFINQSAPNTGVDQSGVVALHPGFNGSAGNPVGEGDQIILGGTNAFGAPITEAADFTLPGAEVAEIHINTVATLDGSARRDVLIGSRADDIVDAGRGADVIVTRGGWDVIDAGGGRDVVLAGGGDDRVDAGRGRDLVFGGTGEDTLSGGAGRDLLFGGKDADTFVYATGDGRDTILDFGRGDDRIALSVDGISDFHDVLDSASDRKAGVTLNFGDGDRIVLAGVSLDGLAADDFLFV